MWILKNSTELLDNFNSNSLSSIHSIKTYGFSTLCTNIPHTKLKSRLAELIRNTFRFKNGKKRYEYIVVGYKSTYFVRNHSEAKNKYTEDDDYVPIFRQPIGSTAHWSDSPLVRQPIGPTTVYVNGQPFCTAPNIKGKLHNENGRRFFYCFYMKFLQWSISSSRMIYTTHNMQAYLYCSCELPVLLGL